VGTVVVLGGCGAVGSVAAKTLAARDEVARVVVADQALGRAQALAAALGPKASAVALDATSADSVRCAADGADVVLNCVGPFHRTVTTVLGAVLDARLPYVDIDDDVDVTLEVLGWDARAKAAGVTALIGMGASPGATNLLAKLIADTQLDRAEAVDVFHTHGGEPVEGAGVVGHRFHCMSIPIPMFLDGELRHVSYFGEDGIALRATFDFPGIGPTPIFPYPHPEQVTLPRFLPVRRVTNKGSVLPIEYYHLTGEACRLGLASTEPVDVGGRSVVPRDFAVAWLVRERERILRETAFGAQRGCMSVIVQGTKDGRPREVRVHIFSRAGGLGEGTGVPAAVGALLMLRGAVRGPGVLPPEGCVDPAQFLALVTEVMRQGVAGGGRGPTTIRLDTIEADGRVSSVEL